MYKDFLHSKFKHSKHNTNEQKDKDAVLYKTVSPKVIVTKDLNQKFSRKNYEADE